MEADKVKDAIDSAFAKMQLSREEYIPQLNMSEIGTVVSVVSGIAKVSGLPGVGYEELLKFPGDLLGIAFNIDEH